MRDRVARRKFSSCWHPWGVPRCGPAVARTTLARPGPPRECLGARRERDAQVSLSRRRRRAGTAVATQEPVPPSQSTRIAPGQEPRARAPPVATLQAVPGDLGEGADRADLPPAEADARWADDTRSPRGTQEARENWRPQEARAMFGPLGGGVRGPQSRRASGASHDLRYDEWAPAKRARTYVLPKPHPRPRRRRAHGRVRGALSRRPQTPRSPEDHHEQDPRLPHQAPERPHRVSHRHGQIPRVAVQRARVARVQESRGGGGERQDPRAKSRGTHAMARSRRRAQRRPRRGAGGAIRRTSRTAASRSV